MGLFADSKHNIWTSGIDNQGIKPLLYQIRNILKLLLPTASGIANPQFQVTVLTGIAAHGIVEMAWPNIGEGVGGHTYYIGILLAAVFCLVFSAATQY